MTDWLFWGIAAAGALLSLGLVFAPLVRSAAGGARRASYDMAIYRDQLREIDADLGRGVLSEPEAAATRVEVSRRLLAAADAEAAEPAAALSPSRLSRRAAPAAVAALALAALGLYAALGRPGLPDQPLERRMARAAAERAERPSQAEVEAMVAARVPAAPEAPSEDAALIARLQQTLKSRPDDLQGHRLLAQGLATLGRWPEARAAQERVLELLGDDTTAQDHVDLAEFMILAAGGYASPEAEAALARALAMEPANPVGRYYSGLTLWQGGRPDLAHRIWSGLLAEGPPGAPWIAPIEAQIDEVARAAGLPTRGAPGPDAADIESAGQVPPEERQAMIEGMVAQLGDRLATEGGPPADWARLIRSLGVLGRRDAAGKVAAEARAKHAGDAAGLAEIDAAARDAGLQ